MKIERMGPEDRERVMAAGSLFDSPARSDAVNRFLADPNHHLLIAYSGDVPAGFVSGVEVTHPDKGTEMFLYELAVDEAHRRQGIGTPLGEPPRHPPRQQTSLPQSGPHLPPHYHRPPHQH